MKRLTTRGIVLARTDFGEADRILTFLTPDYGKLKALAKGVRKSQAKLAGSIELFSVSDITILQGRGEIGTLISARLIKHYSQIVKDINRTNAAYEFMSLINKVTEDQAESDYFKILELAFKALTTAKLSAELTKFWFQIQLLKISGHSPNLFSDRFGHKLESAKTYNFHSGHMHFVPEPAQKGRYRANDIKFLRLAFAAATPAAIERITGAAKLTATAQPLIATMLRTYLRI